MLQIARIWNTLLSGGRSGQLLLLALLAVLTPTTLVYMVVLDSACWVRDRLGFGARPIAKLPERATVAVIALVCIPTLILNIVAVVVLPFWLLLG